MFRRIALLPVILVCLSVSAKRDLTYFWQDKDGIINAQTELTFELVNEIINTDTPSTDAPTQARKAALYLLDQVADSGQFFRRPYETGAFRSEAASEKGNEGVQTL